MTFRQITTHGAVWLAASAAIALASACSGATQAGTRTPTASRRVLLADEIQAMPAASVYEVLTRLRPEWLRRRGQISIRDPGAGEVVVYVDGVRFGGPQSLQNIRPEGVMRMEYLDASDATTRFGTGHGGGAVLVQTR